MEQYSEAAVSPVSFESLLPVQGWTLSSASVAGHRDQLIRFWLAAPDDALQPLWEGSAGQASKQLIAKLTPTSYFSPEQVQLRQQIGQFLQGGFHQPGAVKAMIANFLLSPPGQLRILNPEANLPAWLIPAYRGLYEQGQATGQPPQPFTPPQQTAPAVDFGAVPNSLSEFATNRIQLNRLLGLSNLYYIDPEDQEILSELRQLRLHLAGLVQRCPEAQLEALFNSDLGDRFMALVRSGVQKEPLEPQESVFKDSATRALQASSGGGFGTPGAVNAFLVAMMFYEPGSMQVEQPEQKLPNWLLPHYCEVFAAPLQARA